MMLPPAIAAGGPLFVTDTSAFIDCTLTLAEEVLFARFGSEVVEEIEAVFVNGPACGGAVMSSVIVELAPDASDDVWQVTVPESIAHVQPLPDAATNPAPDGNVSVTRTAVAASGPPLAAASV